MCAWLAEQTLYSAAVPIKKQKKEYIYTYMCAWLEN